MNAPIDKVDKETAPTADTHSGNDTRPANEIAPDRGSPRIQARSEQSRFLALLPVIVTITVLSALTVGGWLVWQSHHQAQQQSAEGNVASKTSIGKRRNDDSPESARRLGADGEDTSTSDSKPPAPAAIEQENRRPNVPGPAAQPIPVVRSGTPNTTPNAPETPPRSRYDAPMRFGDIEQDAQSPGQTPIYAAKPSGSSGTGSPASTTKTRPVGSPPDYSVPTSSMPDFNSFPAAPVGKGTLNLQTLKTPKAEATLIGNRDFILAKGASMDCDLDTALRSNQPGLVRCSLVKDVWSDNGAVVLAERGSSMTGEYSATVQQGQAEIQVIWNRIKTPYGVVVDLASPATDALGRAGIDGTVDNHWGERVGAAFLLSFVKDAVGYATATHGTNTATTGTVYSNTASTGESMADTVLKQTINIPPTVNRAQGTRVKVLVARDLDFSTVYELKRSGGSHAND